MNQTGDGQQTNTLRALVRIEAEVAELRADQLRLLRDVAELRVLLLSGRLDAQRHNFTAKLAELNAMAGTWAAPQPSPAPAPSVRSAAAVAKRTAVAPASAATAASPAGDIAAVPIRPAPAAPAAAAAAMTDTVTPLPPETATAAPETSGRTEQKEKLRSGRERGTAKWLGVLGNVAVAIAVIIAVLVLALAVGPRLLPYQTFTVLSGSMEPAIPTGSIIILRPVAAKDLVAGDIITFRRPDRPDQMVTHRIVDIEAGPQGPEFITKGDANNVADRWRIPASGEGWRFAFAIPYLGFAFAALQSPMGRLGLLVVPAVVLGLVTLYELWMSPAQRRSKQGTEQMSA